jgi:hypothetical protein
MMELQEEVTLPARLRVTPSAFLFACARRSQPGLPRSSCRKLCEAQFDRFSVSTVWRLVRKLSTGRFNGRARLVPRLGRTNCAQRSIFSGSSDDLAHGRRYRTKRHRSLHIQITRGAMNPSGRNLTASNVPSGRPPCDRAWPRRSVAALKAWFATVLSNSQQTWRSPK